MLLRIIAMLLLSCSTLGQLSAGLVVKFPPVGYFPTQNVLTAPSYHSGFFSALFIVLGFLEESEKNNRDEYLVDFGLEGAFYEPSKGENWWTYYFTPISIGNGKKIDQKKFVLEEEKSYYSFNTLSRNRKDVNSLINKYVQVNANVKTEVDRFDQEQINGAPLIGVSFQKPGIKSSGSRNFSTFYTAIDACLKEDLNAAYKLFVSTDDSEFLQAMIDRYDSRVIYREVPRATPVEKIVYDSETPNYDRGFDELVECLVLAKCEAIVRTNSHISMAASFFNSELKMITVRLVQSRSPRTLIATPNLPSAVSEELH